MADRAGLRHPRPGGHDDRRQISAEEALPLLVLAPMLHRDPAVWGDDAEVFNPDNFSREAEAARPIHAYKPFGNGQRACIGRQFAMQEAALVLGMVLQRFKLIDHTRYQLKIKESLTIKPDGLKIKVRPRTDPRRSASRPRRSWSRRKANGAAPASEHGVKGEGRVLTVLYGTSLGTCRDIADQISDRAGAGGFQVACNARSTTTPAGLPESGTLVVVTSTYNGSAPDSATKMETAIREKRIGEIERPDLTYAVLGCGNTQWKTYQAFPKLIESTLRQTGAKSLLPRGEADGNGDFDEAVERWMGDVVEGARRRRRAGHGGAAAPKLKIAFSDEHATRASVLPESGLSARGGRQRRAGARRDRPVGFQQGGAALLHAPHDHPPAQGRELPRRRPSGGLCAQPARGGRQHHRAARPAGPTRWCVLDGQGSRMRHLPIGKPVTVRQLLTDFVELQDAATRSDVRALMEHTRCPITIEGARQARRRGRGVQEGVRARHHRQARHRLRPADALSRRSS